MDFLKKHYEKVLLGVVLLALAIAAACLPFVISSEQDKMAQVTVGVINPRVTPLTNLDLTPLETSLKRVTTPAVIDFGPPNKVFNPRPWQKTADGKLIPADKAGPTSLLVTNIQPLYLKLTLDKVNPDTNYVIGIEKQAAPTASGRLKKQALCGLNPPTQNDTFIVRGVKGKPDDPASVQVLLELKDTGKTVALSTNQPYLRVDGYTADLRYDPEKKHWPGRRINSQPPQPPITLNGEEYNVVAINTNEVVLSAKVNGKKWTIKANQS